MSRHSLATSTSTSCLSLSVRYAAAALFLLAAAPASADRFCYYWIDGTGDADTYSTPPVSLAGPPFASNASLGGHLVIGLAKESCRKSILPVDPSQITKRPVRVLSSDEGIIESASQ